MRIFSCRDVRDESLFLAVEVNEHKGGEHKNANDSVTTESRFRAEVCDEQACENCESLIDV